MDKYWFCIYDEDGNFITVRSEDKEEIYQFWGSFLNSCGVRLGEVQRPLNLPTE